MADTDDYLSVYKKFFDDFAATVNPDDQLPVRVAGYFLREDEIVGEIVDWTLQYLNQKNCPAGLTAPIARQVLDEVKAASKKDPESCGFVHSKHAYDPLRLMHAVVRVVNDVCGRYCDNGRVLQLPRPKPGPPISTCAIRNSRRLMEDRHVIVHDLHAVFGIPDPSPASYYAVFDGHAGTDAAIYGVSHLHQFLAESPFYPKDPVRALKDAFRRTDQLFIEKSQIENLRSGTTVVCALIRPEEKKLYVAWLGDSQALLVRRERMVLLVNPHKPDRPDERERIEKMGGCVMYFGTWRVNGQLAVSRAIGDSEYKPYVCAEPDVTEISLDGSEDFLVLACDGLWDFVTEQQVAAAVYLHLHEHPDDVSGLSEQLVCLSKEQGSTDNISVIVALLRPARDMDMGGGALLHPPESLRGHERRDPHQHPHQHHHEHEHDQDDDLGPETSVDDGELQRQQLADLDPAAEPRQEAPTPPAASLLPGQCEPDNVADSGEDSEDEWNYYKIEPTEKAVNVDSLVQTKQPVCPESTQLNLEEKPEDIFDMESRLNPDAKEFVPSPTHSKQSFEDAIISQSPVGKIMPFDNVEVPSMAQFQQEISQRPGEVSKEDALSNSGYSPDIKSDILNGCLVMDDDVMKKYGDSEFKLTEQNLAAFTSSNPFEVSEVSSTKAVYGDESAASFMTSTSDILQKNLGTSASNVEASFTETDFVASETSGVKQSEDFIGFEASGEFTEFKKGLDESLPTDFSPVKESGTISFELQKDIAPTMEECPERVKLTDDLINPFSHEQPITEMEECEQLPETERTDLLNESFEHGPDFTLEAYELRSPLNPCAPSFDYKNLEDGTDEPKVSEKNQSVEAVEQKPSDVPPDLASGVTNSQSISTESPTELSDKVHKELTDLEKDLFPSDYEKALLPEAGSKVKEISSFEEVEEHLNKSSQSEKSEKDQFLQYSDEMLNFDQPSVEVEEKSDSVEKPAMLEDKIHEKSTDLMVDKEFMDKINEIPSELMNEFHSRSTELVESSSSKCEVLHTEQSMLLENRLSFETAETDESQKPPPSEEQIMDVSASDIHSVPEALRVCVYPMPVEQSNMKDDVELLSPSSDSREEKIEPLEEEHIHGEDFAMGVKLESLSGEQRDMMETVLSEVSKKTELEELNDLTNNAGKDEVVVSEERQSHLNYLDVETGSAENTEETAEKAVEKEEISSVEQTAEGPEAVDMKPVSDEILKLPDADGSDAKNISVTSVEKGEPEKKVHKTGDGEQTMLHDLNNETELEEPNDLTSNAGKDEDVISKDHLSYVEIETESAEKIEETAVEKTTEKLEVIKPVSDEILKLPDADISDVKNISDTAVEKGESEKEVPKIGDGEEKMLSKVSNETALEEPKDVTSNAGKDVLVSEDLQSNLNYVDIGAESPDKVEETDEKIVEKKDISAAEQTAEKPDAVDVKPVSAEAPKLLDADVSEVKNTSDAAVEKAESEKEVHKTGDGEEVPTTTKTPPPTPTPASQAEVTAVRDASEVKAEEAAAVVAVAAAAVAGITATTAGITTKKEPTSKKQMPLTKDVKKTPVAKDSDKMKPGTKAPVKQSPGTAKVPAKTSPTSPTKLSVPSTPRTSTPKRTQVAPPTLASRTTAKTTTTTTAAKPLSRPASNVTNKPTSLTTQKQSSVTGKVTTSSTAPKPGLKAALPATTKPSQTVRAASAPKPRVPSATTTTATKNPLANGDVKSAEVKKTSVATAKIAPRSHTAPSRTTTASKTAGTASATSVPKTGVAARTSLTSRTGMTNGIGQKPRVTSSTAPSARPATNHQTATDKQHKETANKHISSRRIGPAPSKTSPAKVGVKKSPQTTKGGKTPPAANGSPLISTGAGDEEKKKDTLL